MFFFFTCIQISEICVGDNVISQEDQQTSWQALLKIWRSICLIFPARKRSLGQGNIFTSLCLSTGCGCYDVTSSYGQHPADNTTPWTAPAPGNKRAVCILLECFLLSSERKLSFSGIRDLIFCVKLSIR